MTHFRGFTLLEMTMVLLIVGLLTSSLLMPINTQLQLRRVSETEKKLDQIKLAIISYIVVEQTLPCPDSDDDGFEDIDGSDCDSREGTLPWRSLGLRSGQMDGWGSAFAYAIATGDYQNKTDSSKYITMSNLKKPTGLEIALDTGNNIKDMALAVIYSLGADKTAYNENANGDKVYKYDDYVEDIYDDHLIWLSRYEMVGYVEGYSF
ncbi:type II secretion system protein [Candidatus Albibeggiatoa sp. nov. NOAA]|uniref:type II secretion system protein n=1 Tax=Candidatus Albibeggiatoa sp. nov. NOAA TaxID=3162724 RepID=UPI0032FF54E0|nr:type II secretion system GspH family protein [Thiotrichaceae bacterium]